jgi:hypothetical protein
MKLIADSGSTKTDWALLAGATDDDGICRIATQGINPVHQSEEEIVRILNHELLPQLQGKTVGGDALNVEFYGAGCAVLTGQEAQAVGGWLGKGGINKNLTLAGTHQ